MQIATFQAKCDVELGDKVSYANIATEITDIRCIHYLASQKVVFEFKLDVLHEQWVERKDFVYPIVGKNANQYFDARGYIYFVRAGLGENQFKAFQRKPDKSPGYGEHACRNLPWRETAEEAQEDLDALALRKKWKEVKP